MSCLRARFSFLTEICSFWLILHWCILRMYAMGKGSGKTFTTLRYSFDLLLVTNQKVYKALFKLMSGVFSFIPFWCLCQKSSLFLFNKFSFFTTSLEWFLFSAQIFLAQWGNSSPHRAMSSGTAYTLRLDDIGTGFKPTSPVSSASQADSLSFEPLLLLWSRISQPSGKPQLYMKCMLIRSSLLWLTMGKRTFEIRYRIKNL